MIMSALCLSAATVEGRRAQVNLRQEEEPVQDALTLYLEQLDTSIDYIMAFYEGL